MSEIQSDPTSETTSTEVSDEKKFESYIIGNKDSSGRIIYDIYTRGDEFIIYSINETGLIKDISIGIDTLVEENDIPIKNFNSIKKEFDKLKSVSHMVSDSSVTARVAHALSVGILGETEKSEELLVQIHADILKEYQEKVYGKISYIFGSYVVAFVLIGIILLNIQFSFLEESSPWYEALLVSTFATLGGIISISINTNSLNVDKGLGKKMYFFYGVERNFYSIIGGIFVYILIKSNLLFGFINSQENHIYALLVFGFLAGFSESLIPNALKTLEKNANEN